MGVPLDLPAGTNQQPVSAGILPLPQQQPQGLECLQYSSHHGSHPLHLSVYLLRPLPPPPCQPLLSPYPSPLSPGHQPHHSPAYPPHLLTHSCHTTANWSSSPPYPHHIPPHTPQGAPHTTLQGLTILLRTGRAGSAWLRAHAAAHPLDGGLFPNAGQHVRSPYGSPAEGGALFPHATTSALPFGTATTNPPPPFANNTITGTTPPLGLPPPCSPFGASASMSSASTHHPTRRSPTTAAAFAANDNASAPSTSNVHHCTSGLLHPRLTECGGKVQSGA